MAGLGNFSEDPAKFAYLVQNTQKVFFLLHRSYWESFF